MSSYPNVFETTPSVNLSQLTEKEKAELLIELWENAKKYFANHGHQTTPSIEEAAEELRTTKGKINKFKSIFIGCDFSILTSDNDNNIPQGFNYYYDNCYADKEDHDKVLSVKEVLNLFAQKKAQQKRILKEKKEKFELEILSWMKKECIRNLKEMNTTNSTETSYADKTDSKYNSEQDISTNISNPDDKADSKHSSENSNNHDSNHHDNSKFTFRLFVNTVPPKQKMKIYQDIKTNFLKIQREHLPEDYIKIAISILDQYIDYAWLQDQIFTHASNNETIISNDLDFQKLSLQKKLEVYEQVKNLAKKCGKETVIAKIEKLKIDLLPSTTTSLPISDNNFTNTDLFFSPPLNKANNSSTFQPAKMMRTTSGPASLSPPHSLHKTLPFSEKSNLSSKAFPNVSSMAYSETTSNNNADNHFHLMEPSLDSPLTSPSNFDNVPKGRYRGLLFSEYSTGQKRSGVQIRSARRIVKSITPTGTTSPFL